MFTGTSAGAFRTGPANTGAVTGCRAICSAAMLFTPYHDPPGRHPQPAAPHEAHVPEWYGNQPQGYRETQEYPAFG